MVPDNTRDARQDARDREREVREKAREIERDARQKAREIELEARESARLVRDQARIVRDQAREVRDQARQMADAQREMWRGFRDDLRSEFSGEPRKRPQQPSLSLEQIIKAAIDIADREGKDAISMRRIAAELQAGAMSLYWHVANKDELLQQMVDETYAEMELPPKPTGDWRADLRLVASETRQVFLRHPWVAQLGPISQKFGLGFLRHAEFSFAAFESTRISQELRADIVHIVDDYTIGFATREIMQRQAQGERDESGDQWKSRTDSIFERIATMGIFPVLTRMYKEGVNFPKDADQDRLYFFGLDSLLDGIAIRVTDAERKDALSRIGNRFV